MKSFWKRIACLATGHRWVGCKFIVLGSTTPDKQCLRCKRVKEITA